MNKQPQLEPSSCSFVVFTAIVLVLLPARLLAVICGYPLMPVGYSMLQFLRDAIVGIAFWVGVSVLCYNRFGHRGCYLIAVVLGIAATLGVAMMTEGDLLGFAFAFGAITTISFGIVFWALHSDGVI